MAIFVIYRDFGAPTQGKPVLEYHIQSQHPLRLPGVKSGPLRP